MSFFQNPLTSDFYGALVLGDRQFSMDFKCPRNSGRGDEYVTVWNEPTYDLSGNDGDGDSKAVLTISFALNNTNNWSDFNVTISASSLAATTANEVIASLQANTDFADYFTASLDKFGSGKDRVVIKQKSPITRFRFYIKNGRAESVLNFNKKAGVAELPAYFARHTIANRFVYTDSQSQLIELDDSGSVVDQNIIDAAGFAHGSPSADWQLLRGRSGIFQFKKITVDGSNRITQIIEYPAGALEGDMAKKTTYSYTSANTSPDKICEVPYRLESADLVTP